MKYISALLLLSSAFCLAKAGTFTQDVDELAKADNGPIFNEDQDGYDKHSDIFYYLDDQVATEYARANYKATQVTLAGQAVDQTGRPVKPALYPFAVAQRSFKQIGTLMDRWDVKDTGKDAQYLALYHGKGSDFVVNKVRAHLLRNLANALNDQVPALDRTAEADAQEHPERVEEIHDQFRSTIDRIFREVDETIRQSMRNNDDSKASATVAIITRNFIVTVGLGRGSVIAYDGNEFERTNLIDQTGDDDAYLNHLFGAKKSRTDTILPRVQFHSRLETNYYFLMLETPSVTSTITSKADVDHVLAAVTTHKDDEGKEQGLYLEAVINILADVERSLSAFTRFFMHSDYSVILVGLETDYNQIH